MAEHLASIFGTEKDRVNCPFYFKIGACRHGDRCSRLHNRPTISPTLLLSNMYQRPDMITPGVDAQGQPIDPHKIQEHFEDFYEDIFEELCKFGEIESLNVCDNLADHMIGNVYVQFKEEDHAAAALQALQGRFYNGRPIIADFSPVTDFREATCRQFEENNCNRGGYCNFMHVKLIGRDLRRKLFGRYRGYRVSRSRSRSLSPPRHHRRDNDRRERDYRDRDHRGSRDRYDRGKENRKEKLYSMVEKTESKGWTILRSERGTTEKETETMGEDDMAVQGGAEVLQPGKGARNAVPGLSNGIEKERKSSEADPLLATSTGSVVRMGERLSKLVQENTCEISLSSCILPN
ncbi:Splicing factor U2af small subunit A [Morus notabilis]|uniref:Splicing factor U2af small subunit A n=1 Tax=Morus notabilis TaxID=981085 RepID=W9R4I7_9ROSA|nr:Splicing factor U2af small subunit A [Morus notabilis]